MNQESKSSPVDPLPERDTWRETRSGAWAGRGFHYQHLVSTLILVRQWAGLAPHGYLVPEGFDDCVVEHPDRRVWIQIKSRKETTFPDAEVTRILDTVAARSARLPNGPAIRSTVVLEQPRTDRVEPDIARLFDDEAGRVFICKTPGEDIVRLLSSRLAIAQVIAEGLASDLYTLVAGASEQNASLPFENRRRISTTEVERRIFERLEAEDPSAIDEALGSGALEPVDFTTPVDEPNFYRGVKVTPGHLAAKLVLDRPKDVNRVLDALLERRHVLVSGPSGSGKSALTWLSASAAAGRVRWFQITATATPADAQAITRFVRARRPGKSSPLGLVLDDVASTNINLWNVLVRELRGIPALYFLGSVRQEDVHLIANQSDTDFVQVVLDEDLADTVWHKLRARSHTSWTHWREPFEQSNGLMLEFVHLLTQGQRLAAVIEEQIRQREHEGRNDELKIIRSAAVLCAHAGEVEASALFALLDLIPDAANLALKRLIDEHLVRESRPGVLGGLHMLRSNALVKASHDETVFVAADTLWNSLPAATIETLPRVVQSVLSASAGDGESQSLRNLAGFLEETRDIDQWAAILTGLGLATLERHVASFMSALEQHGVQPAHWSLASMFADPQLDVPALTGAEQLNSLQDAILEFRASPKRDLRRACLQHLRAGSSPPRSDDIVQTNRLLSSLAPICGGDSMRIALPSEVHADPAGDIRQTAALLSTAHHVDPELARSMVEALGGEQNLLDRFHSQFPWTTHPTIESSGQHGRTVRSDWYQVDQQHKSDPHETICEICETLIGLSPCSDAAASDVVDPAGQVVSVGDHRPWSKNMPRANLPSTARVSWNVAFRQILRARSARYSLTDYTTRMASLVRRTERVFRSFTEKWIKPKRASNVAALTSEINSIVASANELVYTAREKPPSTMTEPAQAGTDDTLGALLTGVLGNLVRRLSELGTAKATATFAGSLHGQANVHHQSDIWRTMTSPPLRDLAKLSERLADVSSILHEFAHDHRPDAIQRIVKTARRASAGNGVRTAARHCRERAERRFKRRLRELEKAIACQGWSAKCHSRPINEDGSPYWPAREVAILVEIDDLAEQWLLKLEEILSLGAQHLKNDWPFRTVPVMNGHILPSMALLPSSYMPLRDQDFARHWSDFIDQPMHSSDLLDTFEAAADACVRISAIVRCRGVENFYPDENEVLSTAFDTFKSNRENIEHAADRPETEHFALALDYLDRTWARLVDEVDAVKAGRAIEEPVCMTPHLAIAGEQSQQVVDIAVVRFFLLQAECDRAVVA